MVVTQGDDGRRARRTTNRSAVVDALLAGWAEGDVQPSAAAVAARAGVSARSLFRYFTDIDELVAEAATVHVAAGVAALDPGPAAGALAARIDAVVAARARVWESGAATERAVRRAAATVPAVADEIARARAQQRRQLKAVFAAEITALGADGPGALAAVETLCSFEAWELMRTDQRLSRPKAAAALTRSLTRILRSGR
jgi:TetR/AcrR family transcriptional regulator of autoinduction and epiphytic fitness